MRIAFSILALGCVVALAAPAADIDGKWTAEVKMAGGKKAGKRGGAAQQTSTATLDLKSEGDKVTGSIVVSGGRRDRTLDIKDGKIEGNRFSFTTVQTTRKGESKQRWEGVVEGNELKGTRTPENARRGAPFTAKRKT